MTTAIILPIQGSVDPGFLAGLAALQQGLTGAGAASEAAGQKAAASGSAWERSANAFNETHQAVSTIAAAITGAIARVGALSDEQARLDATSRRLGLDFDEAAAAAGRFVDETEAMGVANRFASADINLTQQQLNDVMRVAGSAADALGTDVAGATDTLREALITGRERGLMQFGEEMRRTAGHAHTVEERFAALHARAGTVTVAIDDSAAAMARFADRIEDSERTVAAALTAEIARLDQVAASTDTAAGNAIEWDHNLRAIGSTLGYVSSLALSGLQIVGGAIGSVVGGITGTISIAAAGLEGLVSTRSLSGARSAMSRELAAVRSDGLAVQAADLLAAGIARAEALAADQSSTRTTVAPDAPTAARPRPVRPSRGGGGTGAHEPTAAADMTFTAEQAASEEQAARIRDLEDLAGLAHDRAQARIDEEINGRLRAEQAANDTLEAQKQAATDALGIAEMEDANLRRRLEAHERFTGRLAELNDERVHGAQRAAEFTNQAFESMGKAIGTHVQALVDGRESVGVALQGMLSDTLISVGKEAVIQGGMEIAKGFAALAGVVTAPLAPGHFAAGAAFMAVGAAAGVAGAALAPSAAAPSGAAAGRAAAGGLLNDRPSNAGEGMAPVTINYFAPVIGGREATDSEIGTRFDRYDDAARARLRRAA